MLDPAYRWDSVQNVPSSATTKFQGPIYTATPYKSKVKKSQFPLRAIFNVAEMGRFNVGEIGTARIIHSKSNVEDVVDVANDDLDEAKRSNRREHTPPTGFVVWLRDHGPSRIASIALTKIRCVRHPLGMIGGLGDWGIPQWMELPYLSPL